MTSFRVTTTDGRTVSVQGDDPEEAAKAAEEWVKANPLTGVDAFKAQQRTSNARMDAFRRAKGAGDPEAERAAQDDFLNGMTLGLWGQGKAALAAGITGAENVADRLQGNTPRISMKDAYVGQRELDNAEQRAFTQQHPVAAPVVGVAGALAMPGVGAAGKLIAGKAGASMRSLADIKGFLQSAGLLPRVVRGAATGATLGGVAGGLTADPGQEAQGAAQGARAGAIMGAAAPAAGAVAGQVGSKIIAPAARTAVRAVNRASGGMMLDAADTAAARLTEALKADGASPDVIDNVIADWKATGAPPAALLDIAAELPSGGRNTMRLLRAAAAKGGQAGNIASKRVGQVAADLQDTAIGRTQAIPGADTRTAPEIRQAIDESAAPLRAGSANRILADATSMGVSPAAAQGEIEAVVQRGREAAAPLYAKAYAEPAPQSDLLDNLMGRPSMRQAMNRAVRIAAEEGRDPTGLGFDLDQEGNVVRIKSPTMQTMDYVKRGLDDVLEGYRDRTTNKLRLDEQGRAILSTLKGFRGELTRLRPSYGDALAASGDYLSAHQAYQDGAKLLSNGAVTEAQFAKRFGQMSPAEQDAFKGGIANHFFDLAQNGKLDPGLIRTPRVRAKLETAFGPKAAEFMDGLQQEASLASGTQVAGASGERAVLSDLIGHGSALDAGLDLLNLDPDKFSQQIATLGPAQRETLKAGARQAITNAIGKPAEGSTGLLNKLATATNVRRNLSALLGEGEASGYQAAIGRAIDQLKNARYIDPDTGSQSYAHLLDEGLLSLPQIPTSKLGLVTAAINKLRAGATLTDAERTALVQLGTGDAADAATTLAPRLSAPKRPELLPYFTPGVGAYAGRRDH